MGDTYSVPICPCRLCGKLTETYVSETHRSEKLYVCWNCVAFIRQQTELHSLKQE